eukprot:jgi/Botrbrau1/3777/Bobra.0183s0012.1
MLNSCSACASAGPAPSIQHLGRNLVVSSSRNTLQDCGEGGRSFPSPNDKDNREAEWSCFVTSTCPGYKPRQRTPGQCKSLF